MTTDQFVAMGGSGAPDLPEGSEGEVFDNTLQLTADFSAAVSSADDNTVSMKLLVGLGGAGYSGDCLCPIPCSRQPVWQSPPLIARFL